MAGFVSNIAKMQKLAERSPGFLWRLTDKSYVFPGDPRMTCTVSAWESPQAMADFAFRTVHVRFYARREEWMEPLDKPWIAMWEIEDGAWPTLEEALSRLEHLQTHGPSPRAYGWESVPEVQLARPVSPEIAAIGTG